MKRAQARANVRFSLIPQYVRAAIKSSAKKHSVAPHADSFQSYRAYMVMPGQPVWMDRSYAEFAQEAYVRNVIAHRAIDLIGTAAASVPLELVGVSSRGHRRDLPQHAMIKLVKRPNPTQTYADFFQALYKHRLISGNAFIQAVGPKDSAPLELFLLRPDRVGIIAGKGMIASAYRYNTGNATRDYPVDRITGLSSVLHIKEFHPLNDWYGLSPVEAAAYSIDQHNQASAWNQSLLQNGARPSGALIVKSEGQGAGHLSEDQFSRLRQQMNEQFSGAGNAGKPLLLEGGLDWKEMSMTPHDMDFVQAKHSSARDIALAFGVPPQLLGIPGDNTYSNLQEARLALWEQTILPLVQSTAEAMSRWLSAHFRESLELVPNTDGIVVLALRNQAIWDRVERASFLSDDEKREAVGYMPAKYSA